MTAITVNQRQCKRQLLLASWLFFKETIRQVELLGIAFIASGILVLVLY